MAHMVESLRVLISIRLPVHVAAQSRTMYGDRCSQTIFIVIMNIRIAVRHKRLPKPAAAAFSYEKLKYVLIFPRFNRKSQ